MKKFIFVFMAIASIVMSANAQYVGNKLTDNVSVGLEVGGYTPLQNHAFCGDFAPTFGLFATKYFNPVVGFEVEAQSFVNPKGAAYNTTTFPFMTNIGGNAIINVNNLILGYKGKPCVLELETVYGLGWGHVWRSGNNNDGNFLTSKAGVNVNWNITDAWTLSVRPAVIWDLSRSTASGYGWNYTHGAQYDINHANLEIKVGVAYNFTGSNGKTYMTPAKLYDQAEVDALNAEINNLRAKTAQVEIKEIEKVVEKKVPFVIDATYVVMFAQNSAELSDNAKGTLDRVPNNAKAAVVATASPEGSTEYNQALSERRANVVAEYLKAHGVEITKVQAIGESLGETSNRIAIVTVAKQKMEKRDDQRVERKDGQRPEKRDGKRPERKNTEHK